MKKIILVFMLIIPCFGEEFLGVKYVPSDISEFEVKSPKIYNENLIRVGVHSKTVNIVFSHYVQVGDTAISRERFDINRKNLLKQIATDTSYTLHSFFKAEDSVAVYAFYPVRDSWDTTFTEILLSQFDLWKLPQDILSVSVLKAELKIRFFRNMGFDIMGRKINENRRIRK